MIWLIAFLLPIFYVAAKNSFFKQSPLEYYVCGRNAGSLMVALSILASCVGGSATIGMIGLAWQVGTPAFWWLGSGAAGLTVLAFFLAKKARETNAITMPQIIGNYLGADCRLLASVIIATAWLAILAAQFTAMGLILDALTGMGARASLLAGAIILLVYAIPGGQSAVMRSDIWQFALLFASLAIALFLVLQAPGAKDALVSAPIEITNDGFPFSRFRYYLLILGGSYVICPMLFGRLLSARNQSSAMKGSLLAVMGLVLTACLIVALGIACTAIVPEGANQEDVLNFAIRTAMPEWCGNLMLLGLLGAIISSADSCLMTAASVCANDIIKKGDIRHCQEAMCLLSAVALLMAFQGSGILSLLLMANDIYVCGIVGPVLMAMTIPGRKTRTRHSQFIAMLGGGILGGLAAITQMEIFSYAGIGFSCGLSAICLALPLRRRSPARVAGK